MKIYSLFIIVSILLISCKKDDTVPLPDYKQLEMITQNDDTLLHITYENNKAVQLISSIDHGESKSYYKHIITYENGKCSKMSVGELGSETFFREYSFYYSNDRVDSVYDGHVLNYYTYANDELFKISTTSGILTIVTFFTTEDKNIIETNTVSYAPGRNEKIVGISNYQFDDKVNAFSSIRNEPFVRYLNIALDQNFSVNNVVRREGRNDIDSQPTSVSLHEFTYDEDGYPKQRKTVSRLFDETDSFILKYYYKED